MLTPLLAGCAYMPVQEDLPHDQYQIKQIENPTGGTNYLLCEHCVAFTKLASDSILDKTRQENRKGEKNELS